MVALGALVVLQLAHWIGKRVRVVGWRRLAHCWQRRVLAGPGWLASPTLVAWVQERLAGLGDGGEAGVALGE